MSVIGPRPGLWNQDILTAERDKYNANDVKPGLCKLMVDLVSIRDHSSGECLQEFPRMVRMTGRLPVKEDDGMGPSQRPVSIDPHVSLPAVFDLCRDYLTVHLITGSCCATSCVNKNIIPEVVKKGHFIKVTER